MSIKTAINYFSATFQSLELMRISIFMLMLVILLGSQVECEILQFNIPINNVFLYPSSRSLSNSVAFSKAVQIDFLHFY